MVRVMKKRLTLILMCVAMLCMLVGCSSFSLSISSVGKDNTSAKRMAVAINEDISSGRRSSGYQLYGIDMSLNSEGIGTADLIYTKKLPQDLKYSDILIVSVDTRTGAINSVEDATFATHGTEPSETIVNGAPLQIENWKQDSGAALSTAQQTFFDEDNFIYNYALVHASVTDGIEQYRITFVSLVNHLQYICRIDAMSGAVLSKEIIDL